jgi:uncharacterized membrane protein
MATILRKNTRSGQAALRDDLESKKKRHARRMSWFHMEMARQAANRFQMAMDEAYYDGEQWTPSEAAEVRNRGQNPVVFNEVKPVVDFLIGTERRSRIDFLITNRTDNSEEAHQDAQAKTALLKFIDQVNRTQFVRSQVADDQFKAGLGWKEVGVRADPTDYPIYVGAESWRNMLYDSLGQSPMTDDWRYIFRFKEVDFDIAEAMCPRDKVDQLRQSIVTVSDRRYMDHWMGQATGSMGTLDASGTGKWISYDAEAWLNNPRERVMLIECWNIEPVPASSTDQGEGLTDRMRMRMRASIMTEADTIMESWSPYRHGKYPFIPQWCYRRKGDGAPYGPIRQHRGPQDSLNKHMSKAQHRMNTRQVLLEKGALDDEIMDLDQLEDLISDPAAVMQFAQGALSGGKVQIKEGAQLAAADVQLAEKFAGAIRALSPVSMEDRGQDPSDVSGKARQIRRDQGSVIVAEMFDNMLLSRQIEGELTLSLAEQYHTEPLTFALKGEGQTPKYVSINQDDPNDTGNKLNDITKRKASFEVGESPWQQSMAEAAFDSLMAMSGELAKVAPQVVVAILDILFSMHPSLPKREQLLSRIRQVTGQTDPDERETPEMAKKKADEAKLAQARYDAELSGLVAQVKEAKAKGEKLDAEGMAKRLETLYMAAQAAQVLTTAPQIAPVADELARSVGFVDQAGDGALNSPVPTVAAPVVPEAQQADGALAGGMAGAQSPTITGIRQEPQ